MRVTKEVAEQNRMRILETAVALFKTRGSDNVSISDLAKAAGFTHGGFYNHFKSKDDLIVEAIKYAFDEALGAITQENGVSPAESIASRLALYPSPEHRDEIGGGCPTGSFPVDVARQSVGAQEAFADGLERYLALVEGVSPGKGEGKRRAAIAALSALVGGIILSRAVRRARPELSDELLEAVRSHHERQFDIQ